MLFAVATLRVAGCILFPLILALYGLGVAALASWRNEEDRNDRIFLLIYAIAILVLAVLLISSIHSMYYR